MPATLLGGVGSMAIASSSNLIDQGIDNFTEGKSITDVKNYSFTKAAIDGVVAGVSFGVGNYLGTTIRNQAIRSYWARSSSPNGISRFFYNNPSMPGFMSGNMIDLFNFGVKNADKLITITLPEIRINRAINLINEIQKTVDSYKPIN